MQWHLHRLDYADGKYFPTLVQSFDDPETAMLEQRRLMGRGMSTQVSNVKMDTPHRVFDL